MPRVDVPDYGTFIDFPDGTPPAEMQAALATNFPPKHGIVDVFKGAGARIAQGINSAAGGMLTALGADQGAEAYKQGADYWAKKAEAAGSSGVPAQIYQGLGAAPQGVAEFVAGVPYAAAKGGLEGFRKDGLTGAVQGAGTEALKRFAIGKVFKGIEQANLTPVAKSGVMAGTMGAQTAAEGGSLQDVVASTVTGAALMPPGGRGRSDVVRQRMQAAGASPEVAMDLSSRGAADAIPQGPGFVTAERDPRVFSDTQGQQRVADSEHSPDFGRPASPVLDAENAHYDNVNPAVRQGAHPDAASIEVAITKQQHPYWSDAEVWQEVQRQQQTGNPEQTPAATDMSTVRPTVQQPIRQSEDSPGLAPRNSIGNQDPGQRFDGLDRLWDGKTPEQQRYNPEIPPTPTDWSVTRPTSAPERPAEDAPARAAGPYIADSESFNHDALPTAAVKPADSLSVPASVKVAVVGTPAEIDALPRTGRVRVDHNGASYLLDPFQAKKQFGSVRAAADMLRSGGDEAGKVLGYPPREGVADLQTAAVTKTGEVLTEPEQIKQAATAGQVAYAAEGAPKQLAASVGKVAEAMAPGKELPPNSIVTQVNGLDGRPLGYEVTPHDGTPKGMHDAVLKNARAMNNYNEASNAETIHLVTDAEGKPTNRINARFGELEPLQPDIKGGDLNERQTNADAQTSGRQEGREGLLDGPTGGDKPPVLLNIGITPTAMRDALRKVSLKILSTKVGSHLAEAVDQLARAVHPIVRGPEAKRTGEILIEQMGHRERGAEQFVGELNRSVTHKLTILDRMQSSSRTLADAVFNKLPEQAKIDFMQRMDTGGKQETPQLQQVADTIQKMFERKVEQVRALGNGALENVRENYFPHMWERSPDGREADITTALSKRPLEGSKSFDKHRVFNDVQAGLDAGYKPISTNPLDLVMLKMAEMDRYITTHTALQEMSKDGVVKMLPAGEKAGEGWAEIDGRYGIRNGTGEHYVAREEVAQIFNNYLSKSLYSNPYVGKLYSGYMAAANNLNMFQLGVGSFFHAGFTSGEAVISHVALGMKEVARGNLPAAAKYFAEAPTAFATNAMKGDRIIKALTGDGSDTSMAPILDYLEMAGARRMNQNERFFTNHTQDMLKAWAEGRKGTAAVHSVPAAVEQMARPILEYLVPRHKYGVFAEMAEQFVANHPDATHQQTRTAMQQIWNRVDSRLGQVVYDRLFAHAVAKNVVQGLIRAPGWTGGTILEVGGGVKDMADMLTGGTKRAGKGVELSDRAAYVLSLLTVTAVTNGIMTAAFTGEKPKGMDFLAFRDGGTDETGKPTRFVLPTYAKDIYAYTQDWSKTLIDKTHPLISLSHDLIKNKDYYGVQIADPEANRATRTGQQALYAVKAFQPFWMRGAGKTWDREGGGDVVKQMDTAGKARVAARVLAPQIGVMPATSAYTNSPLEKFINENIPRMDAAITPEESDHKKAVNALANQFMRLTRTGGDTGMVLERARQMAAAGDLTERDMKRIDEIVASPRLNRNFGKLPYTMALKAFNETATDEERKQILSAFGDKMDNWAEKRPAEFEKHKPQILQAVEHARRLMQ